VLIEDCAHRIDLLDAQEPRGHLACYSFNALKELPGGEGGMIWGMDPRFEGAARQISNLGLFDDTMKRAAQAMHADYHFGTQSGLKLRSNDVAAALVLAALPGLRANRATRRAIAARYDQALLPYADWVRPLARDPGRDSYLMYIVRTHALETPVLRRRLAARGVSTSMHYPPLSRHPLFAHTPCPVAESLAPHLITLPSFLDLDPARQEIATTALEAAIESLLEPEVVKHG